MFIQEGDRKIKHSNIWFLSDIKDFTERKMYIFEFACLKKGKSNIKTIVILFEKHSITGEIFQHKIKGINAIKVIEREKSRLLYTSNDIKIVKGKPYQWVYGINKEIRDKKGDIVKTKHYRCDFYGQKELII